MMTRKKKLAALLQQSDVDVKIVPDGQYEYTSRLPILAMSINLNSDYRS